MVILPGKLPIGVACRLMVQRGLAEMLWDAGTTSRYPAAAVVQNWGSDTSLTFLITQLRGRFSFLPTFP